jgi:glutathione S-transferase
MAALPRVTFFHAPNSRSGGARALLEELGAPYDMTVLNLRKGEQRDAKYLAVNPMGKVPAIVHDGQLITEQGAVFTYLADLYPQAGLAPALGDPLRGPYLRWMFFYGSCFEPAVVDRSQKNTPAPASTCPYGDFDTMLKTVSDQLKKGPWMLGDKFTALDVLYGGALRWTVGFNLVPATPEIKAYIERVAARPAIQRAAAADTELAASQPS